MKVKSTKLRFLITIYSLFKYTDAEHRINSVKLNEYLRPYGLDYTRRVLSDSISTLRDFGVEVKEKGGWNSQQGVWIENPFINEDELRKLIFAVSSNPMLSFEQSTDILKSLKNIVNIYQESLLHCQIKSNNEFNLNNKVYKNYIIIKKAIDEQRRITYETEKKVFNTVNNTIEARTQGKVVFTPKDLFKDNLDLYMIGYHHRSKKVLAINLKDIKNIHIPQNRTYEKATAVFSRLKKLNIYEYIPKSNYKTVYEGPAQIRFRSSELHKFIELFGENCIFTGKDVHCHIYCSITHVIIDEHILHKLAMIKDSGIRFEGPDELIKSVKDYYREVGNKICKR